MDAIAWLFDALISWVPRIIVVAKTHGGVKWVRGHRIVELKPGLYWYWPLTTTYSLIPTGRQTLNTPPQTLMSKEGKQIVVSGVVVYSIKDVVRAIGHRNWDVDETANDITQAAIVSIVTKHTIEQLMENICDKIETDLTNACRKQLRQYGVYVHRAALVDYSTCRTLNLVNAAQSIQSE
jgi:regulator of protease activity HflC (stomatin/prohibitin superfamily)